MSILSRPTTFPNRYAPFSLLTRKYTMITGSAKSMRQTFSVVAGVLLTITLPACSDTPPETGTVPFKASTSPAIDMLRENMSKNAKGSVYTKKTVEADPKATDPKAASGKEAAKKP